MSPRVAPTVPQPQTDPSAAAPEASPVATTASGGGVTWRAWVVGILGTLAVGFGAPYATLVLRGSYVDLDFSTPAAIFLLFILVALVNPVLGWVRASWRLTPAELLVTYAMMIVASAITTMGLTSQLLPILATPLYYGWAKKLDPNLKDWLYITDETAATRFFEGLRAGEAIPWSAWLTPLLAWLPFLLALYWTSICLMALLRKQWSERERLPYPLIQVPLEMTRAENPLLRNPVMWAGFAVAFGYSSLIGLHFYYPSFPAPNVEWPIPFFDGRLTLYPRISFPMIGFFFLANTETVFSLWFFNLIAWFARGMMTVLGVEWNENLGVYGSSHIAYKYLGMGAMAALVAVGFRAAWPHLRGALRQALSTTARGADRDEVMSYRAAFGGVVVGMGVMAGWLIFAGVAPAIVPFLLGAAFVLFIGMTRVVVESGLAEAVPSTIAPGFTAGALGVEVVGRASIAPMAMTYVWGGDLRTLVMTSSAHAFRLGEGLRSGRRALPWAVLLAVVLAALSSGWLTMTMAYQQGGASLNDWFFIGGPQAPFKWAADKLANPSDASGLGWLLALSGAAFTLFLALMRQTYVWWPLHPIGFAVGTTWIMDRLWLSALIAWGLKALIVRYGGLRFFGLIRPFFLGLIIGQFTCNGFWLVLDAIMGQRGNRIFWI